jgi:protein SCO1
VVKKGKEVSDTIFHTVPAFYLYNQDGQYLVSEWLKNKVWVCCFKHLKDEKVAPGMAILMNRIESRTDLDTALKIVTFTLDSESVSALHNYALMVHAGKKQQFLSGNNSQLTLLSNDLFSVADNSKNLPMDSNIIHFYLIDKEGCIRGIYNGLVIKEVDNLVDNISMLETAYQVKENHDRINKDDDDGAM